MCGLLLAPLCLTGCNEMWILFGPGGFFGAQTTGGTLAGTPTQGSSGTTIANPGTTIPTTTQPAAIAPPSYGVSLLDPLLEQTAGAEVVVGSDMDGDGRLDFVSGSDESQPIQLHMRNPADLEYTTFSVAGGGPIARMVNLGVADFDNDGNPDVAAVINDTGFVPVTGATIRGAVVLVFAPADPRDALSWTTVTISASFIRPNDATGMTDFVLGDFDGINGTDVIIISNEVNNVRNVLLYTNPGGANARNGGLWGEFIIEQDAVPGMALARADIDLDGDLDVVAAFPTAKTFNLRWLRNPLVESGTAAVTAAAWDRIFVGQQQNGGDLIDLGDIDNDGDIDVAVGHVADALVQWFENPGPAAVTIQDFPWRVFNIGKLTAAVSLNQVQLVDLNLDGNLDVYATASGNMVGMQRATDVQNYWVPFSILSTNPVAEIGISAFADVNADGLLDIIAPLDREGLTMDQIVVFTRQTPNS